MKLLTNLNLVVSLISALSGILALVNDQIRDTGLKYLLAVLLLLWLLIALLLEFNPRILSSLGAVQQTNSTLLKYLPLVLFMLGVVAIYLLQFNVIVPRTPNDTSLHLDNIPSSIYPYQFTNAYTTTQGILHVKNNGGSGNAYNLEFNSTNGYSNDVGLAFGFEQKQNISIYRQLLFTIEFSFDSMDCKVYLMDIYKNKIFIDLNKSNPGIEQITTRDKKQLFKISLNENFNGIDLKEVTGVYFLTSTETRSGNEKDYFEVQDVRFSNE